MVAQVRRVALVVAAAVLVFSSASSPAVAAPDPIAINVGIQPGDSTAEGFYAQDMGFFTDAGLDVKLTFLLNGPALTSALASGALDLAVASVGVVATGHEHGLPLKYVAPAAMYTGAPPTTIPENPEFGLALEATSGTPRPTCPSGLTDGGTPAASWYGLEGEGSTSADWKVAST